MRSVIATLLLAICSVSYAGTSCEKRLMSATAFAKGVDLAQRTAEALDKSGAQLVILGRSGQDLTKYHLQYSHLSFAYKTVSQGMPVWRVFHELNECGTSDSAIYQQGLGEFFLDDLWRYEAAWVVPSVEVQNNVLRILQDDKQATKLHTSAYSVVSYVWSTKYQQSNQWAIETIALAMDGDIQDRTQAKNWLQIHDYQPSVLTIGALTRLGGRMMSANVAFDDHPNEKRFSSRIETITVDSVFEWMQRAKLSGPVTVIR